MLRPNTSRFLALAVAASLFAVACGDDDGGSYDPAPPFSLVDGNPGSPTYGQERSLASAEGKVVVLFFALYS